MDIEKRPTRAIYERGHNNGFLEGKINESAKAFEIFNSVECGSEFTTTDKDGLKNTFEKKCPENLFTINPNLMWGNSKLFVNSGKAEVKE